MFKIFSLLFVALCYQFSWVAASGCPQHNRCSQNEMSPLVAFTATDVTPYMKSGMKKSISGYTLTNEGYGWNPKTNVFVCYYPGLYFFTFSEQPSSHQRSRVMMYLNNNPVHATWGNPGNDQTGSNSVVLRLYPNDRVYLQIEDSNSFDRYQCGSNELVSFSGFKIQ